MEETVKTGFQFETTAKRAGTDVTECGQLRPQAQAETRGAPERRVHAAETGIPKPLPPEGGVPFPLGRRLAPRVLQRFQFLFILLSVGLAAGCFSDKEQIQFSDEHLPQPTNAAVPAVLPQAPRLEKDDLLKVEVAVYGYLLQRHFWDAGEYTAIFLQADDAEVAAVRRTFPNHVPLIKAAGRAELRPGRTPVDKDTGGPAMILSVDALEPGGDTVEAIGRWYAGDAVTGHYTFELKKNGVEWAIENVK